MKRTYAPEIDGVLFDPMGALDASDAVRVARDQGSCAFVVQTLTFPNGETLTTHLDPQTLDDLDHEVAV